MTFKADASMKELCPACGRESVVEREAHKETLVVRGEPIEIEAEVRRCQLCGETFATLEEEERNFDKAYRKYRGMHDLLQPEEIRSIRGQYGIGQRAFSRLLGWGEITLHRYESGALQDETHNNELLLLKDPINFSVLFERNKDRISPALRERIELKLPNLLEQKKRAVLRSWL